jgi:kynurenine formamidase
MTTPELSTIQTDEDIDRLLPQITNWGRWGKQDQLGTVNFITARQRLQALTLVKKGRTVSLAREISVMKTEGIRRGTYEMIRDEDGSRDYIGMIFHGFALTHLDALCHVFAGQKTMYNGNSVEEVTAEGANKLGIERMAARGISGRGVLLDIATLKGEILEPGTPIFPQDLDKAEEAQHIAVEEGDILFVRTGAGARNTREQRSGLHPRCLPWLHERNVAVLGSDGDNDVHPSEFKRWECAMHSVAIPYMGLPLLDNAELDTLSRVCQEEKRWEFFLTIAPWRFHGATSSPVNPIALF